MKKNKNIKVKQRVLVRETDELGTVTDRVLMKRGGKPMLYYQVKLDAHPDIDRWYWADQLRDIRERCRVTFENEEGQTVIFDFEQDYEAQELSMEVSGRPKNLKKHVGLHATLINEFIDGIKRNGSGSPCSILGET